MTMLDSIDAQVPNAQELIGEYVETIRTYIQEQLDKASQDEKVIAAFEAFLKQIPEFLARPLDNKVTLDYVYVIADEWKYKFDGYVEVTFLNVPEHVMNAVHNGTLLAGYKLRHKFRNLVFTLKSADGSIILDTQFELNPNPTNNKNRLRIIETTDAFDD